MNNLFCHLMHEDKKARLVSLREKATPILATNLLPHFTDHSVSHSDEMVMIINRFVEPLQTESNSARLTDDELFVLYAACYLHDIGMQYENAGNTAVISEIGLEQPWEDLDETSRRSILRKYHHKISAEMVRTSVRSALPPIGIQLDDTDHANEIACLCESHATDAASDRYAKLSKDSAGLRMTLLAALFRISDILEESRRRANPRQARSLLLDMESKLHWWRHYYTEKIEVSSQTHEITLHYDFPKNRFREYCDVIPLLQEPFINEELQRHLMVLSQVNLNYALRRECPEKPHSTAEEMPANVFDEMRNIVSRNREREAEKRANLALRESSDCCKRMISEIGVLIESDLTQAEFMMKLLPQTKILGREGSKRSAWMLLSSAYDKTNPILAPLDRVKTAIELAKMMLDDRFPREAVRTLAAVRGLAEQMDDDLMKEQLLGLWASALSSMCDSGTVDAYHEAIQISSDECSKQTLVDELAEYQFLQGDLEYVSNMTGMPLNNDCDVGHITSKTLVALRAKAMLQGSQVTVQSIDNFAQSLSGEEKAKVLMLKAEIMFLDGNAQEAKQVFLNDIIPLLTDGANDLSLVVDDNSNVVSSYTLEQDSTRDFYLLHDERRRRNVEIWDTEEALIADDLAAEGKHYEALPAYWGVLVRAFRRGYWRGYWWASQRMAKECLTLGLPHKAAFHAMVGMADKLDKKIAEALFKKEEKQLVSSTVSVLISSAHLARHAVFALSLLAKISDVIEDSDVPRITKWLLERAVDIQPEPLSPATPAAAWKALECIALRLSQPLCDEVIKVAREHPAWNRAVTMRKPIILAVTGCLTSASVDAISSLPSDCINLVTEWKYDFDYPESLELFRRVYMLIDGENKKVMAENIFPAGSFTQDPRKLILASSLDIDIGDENQWSEQARITAKIVERQVQRIGSSDKPTVSLGSYGTLMGPPKPHEQRLVVQMDSGIHLRALYHYRNKIKQQEMAILVGTIIKMLKDSDNTINNKIILVEAIEQLADVIPAQELHGVLSVLEPLCKGKISESEISMTHKEATNPLNPFKMSTGDPKRLQGTAIVAYTRLISKNQLHENSKYQQLLKLAMTSDDPVLRRFGFKAAQVLAVLPPAIVPSLIMGTRDPDTDAACLAFAALVGRRSYDYDESIWSLLTMSLHMALLANEIKLRRIAAEAVAKLLESEINHDIQAELKSLQSLALNDSCFSVRAKATTQ